MGVKNLPNITRQLLDHGKSPDTPVALVRWGTTPRQVTVSGTLETIVAKVRSAGLKAPALIVVGDVVNLRPTLKWFEKRPLLGKRIIVTRARQQASDLLRLLSDLGAECLEYPTINIIAPQNPEPLEQAVKNLPAYDWIVFTSANGVIHFFEQLFAVGKDVRALGQMQTAAIGPATAEQLRKFGLNSDIVPETYRAESVVDAFREMNLKGKKILLPRAREARPILPVELTKMGAQVDEVSAYETLKATENTNNLIRQLEEKKVDLITFTSSSTVKNFKALLPPDRFKKRMQGVIIASIGPITTDTARQLDFEVDISAQSFTIPGLVEAILQYYHKE